MKDYTWVEVINLTKKLVKEVDFEPQIIIGIPRGGIVSARLFSKLLNVKRMFCLTVEKVGGERKLKSEILDDLNSKKILLVEDILETGRSLIVAKDYLEDKGAIVKTVSYFIFPISEIKPDFYLDTIEERVGFPWE